MKGGFWAALGATIGLIVVLVVVFRAGTSSERPAQSQKTLTVYCAAGLKPPTEAAIKQYEKDYGIAVETLYAGSGTHLSSIKTLRQGDLFVAAEEFYTDEARRQGLVAEVFPLASQRLVLAVKKGNAAGIESVQSLRDEKLRIGLANPGAAAVGRVSQQVLERSGLWSQVKKNVERNGVFKPTVTDIANDLRVGSIDVAMVWDSTVKQFPELEAIAIDAALSEPQRVALGVLNCAEDPTAALHLARYLAAEDKGLRYYRQEGFEVVAGDPWADKPELTLFLGGMLRMAVQDTIREFAEREGVSINTNFNGCGILVGQIKTGTVPDAYFACDTSFMAQVADHFDAPRTMSQSRMLIAVQKGNPRKIKGLADLKQPDLKVGVCNPDQSALGALTKNLLTATGQLDGVMANVVVQVPTADMLVLQLRSGGLDAAIVYEVNYTPSAEHLDRVDIDHKMAQASQPLAVGKQTRYKQLAARLVERLRDATSQERFLDNGFKWLNEPPAPYSAASEGAPVEKSAVP